jgi:ParB family chromosome partitioning protein
MRIPLDQITASPNNARKVATTTDQDQALAISMQTIGQLQPVLVVGDEAGGYELKAGHRRLHAAKHLGWEAIEAFVLDLSIGADVEVPELAMSAAENMVRAAMHPVDQWRAIIDLRAHSAYSLDTAAAALGITPTLARRLEYLGRMSPTVISAIAEGSLPESDHLRVIAMAPLELQDRAIAQIDRQTPIPQRAKGRIYWSSVARLCSLERIPQSRAMFAHNLMSWEEDLFAEPGSDDQFSTKDIDTFLKLQHEALERDVANSKGRIEIVDLPPHERMPQGWERDFGDIPKRWKKTDPRKVFATLHRSGFRIGHVDFALCAPKAEREAPVKSSAASGERPLFSKASQREIASLKAEAVRERLNVFHMNGPSDMLRALLISFSFRNIHLDRAAPVMRDVITQRLIDRDGLPRDISDREVCELAANLIAQLIAFDAPDVFNGSGPGAEWLARAIDAEMPRTDTADILKGMTGDRLAELAEANGINADGKVATLRKRLVGELPDWRAARFGAEGPDQSPDDDAGLDDAIDNDGGEEQQDMGEAA